MLTTFASVVLATALTFSGGIVATDTPNSSDIVASDCDPTTDHTCATAYADFWAKDAYATFKAPLGDMPEQDVKDAFTATYYGTYETAPEWGDGYAVVPSDKYDGVFHVFVVVAGNPVDSTVTDTAETAAQ
jgi:hypothetical protein